MRSPWWWAGAVALVVGLSACGGKPQPAGSAVSGSAAYQGAAGPYVATGWKAGDATSWDTHMRTRTQSGQNEYVRSGGQ